MHITFVGTPNFSKTVLQILVKKGITPNAIVTNPDKPQGRGKKKKATPVKVYAQKKSIPVFEKLEEITNRTNLVIVAGYGKIIPDKLLKKPRYGFLNVHPSLLPRYRGPAPIQAAILSNDKKTGVSIMVMDEKMDHGPLIEQKEIIINKKNYLQLEKETATAGGVLMAKIIPDWIAGKLSATSQNHQEATYTKIIKKENGRVNWNRDAVYIEKMTRAYYPWPGCYTILKSKILKILEADIQKQVDNDLTKKPGEIFLTSNKEIAVQTGKNVLIIKRLQLQGKNPMQAKDFLLGHTNLIGVVLD